jgi:hypothetical protein
MSLRELIDDLALLKVVLSVNIHLFLKIIKTTFIYKILGP